MQAARTGLIERRARERQEELQQY
jgi:predicted small metal-binding protein